MELTKRDEHPLLKSVETQIEAWRTEQVRSIQLRPEFAAYALVLAACAQIGSHSEKGTAYQTLQISRKLLFSLQFALQCLDGLPSLFGRIDALLTRHLVDRDDLEKAVTVILELVKYVDVRDAYLSYYFRAFDLDEENSDNSSIKFIDPPEWPGRRDHAQREVSFDTDDSRIITVDRADYSYNILSEYPAGLDLGGISGEQFLELWKHLKSMDPLGPAPILQRRKLMEFLTEANTAISTDVVTRFIEIITLSSDDSRLSLFHCPVIPLTTADLCIVPPAVFLARLDATVRRLAIAKGPGVDAVSENLTQQFYHRLSEHYCDGVQFRYTRPHPGGDIDLVVFESDNNWLTLVEVKAFINPDTVPEVLSANRHLVTAIEQIQAIKEWYESATHSDRRNVLDLSELSEDVRVEYAILGNGFVGSDFVDFPRECLVSDMRFLLRPQFQRSSFRGALNEFRNELNRHLKNPIIQDEVQEIELAGVKIQFPAGSL